MPNTQYRQTYRREPQFAAKFIPGQKHHLPLLMSIRRLRYCTAEELQLLHPDFSLSYLRDTLSYLFHVDQTVNRLRNFHPDNPFVRLPIIYTENTKSRRLLEEEYGVPFLRPYAPPTSQGYLRHNVDTAKVVTRFITSARRHGISVSDWFDLTGTNEKPQFPISIETGTETKDLTLEPDFYLGIGEQKTLHHFLEHDRGTEPMFSENLDRKSIHRCLLSYAALYDRLARNDPLRLRGFRMCMTFDTRATTEAGRKKGSLKRLQSTVDLVQKHIDNSRCPHKIFMFRDLATLLDAGIDISKVPWINGRGQEVVLPL